jgi:hypothetical protein
MAKKPKRETYGERMAKKVTTRKKTYKKKK